MTFKVESSTSNSCRNVPSPPRLRRRPRHLHRPAGSYRFPWHRCLPAKKRLAKEPMSIHAIAKIHTQGLDVGGSGKCHIFSQQDLCLDKGRGWSTEPFRQAFLRTRPMLFPQQLLPRRRTGRRRSRWSRCRSEHQRELNEQLDGAWSGASERIQAATRVERAREQNRENEQASERASGTEPRFDK